jgi:4-oxalocrotonate tautomerase
MAIVTITTIEGRDDDTKARLVARLTDVVVETLGAKPQQVRVVLDEVKDGNYAVGGKQVFLNQHG